MHIPAVYTRDMDMYNHMSVAQLGADALVLKTLIFLMKFGLSFDSR